MYTWTTLRIPETTTPYLFTAVHYGPVNGHRFTPPIFTFTFNSCSSMAENPLAELKRDQLGNFLRDRGIPFSSRNKGDRLQLAIEAERRNVGVLVDDKLIVGLEYRDLLSLENGLITLPDPNKMSAGWEQNFSSFPNTTRVEVEEYLKSCKKTYGFTHYLTV